MLEVRELELRRGDRPILRGVSFAVGRGGLVALMGPSGCGKTTVLRAIAALESFDAGTIRIDGVTLAGGRAPDKATLRELRRRTGLVFQFHCLFEHLSVLDNVTLAPVHAHGVPVASAKARAGELLEKLGVAHRAAALPRALSGGEAQRVAIARALAVDPPLLMMDEPTASLDAARRSELGGLLTALSKENRTILVSTHDEEFVRDFAGAVLRLDQGRLDGLTTSR